MNLREVVARLIRPCEERHYRELMEEHRYLGSLQKIGETLKNGWVF